MKLRVFWIPQIPMKSFNVPVESLEEAAKILDVLAAYDLFQYENQVKGDFCNEGGLETFDEKDTTDSPNGSWVEWYDPETGEDFREWRQEQNWQKTLDSAWDEMRS